METVIQALMGIIVTLSLSSCLARTPETGPLVESLEAPVTSILVRSADSPWHGHPAREQFCMDPASPSSPDAPCLRFAAL